MTDIELVKACALAMGLELIDAVVKGTPHDVRVVLFDPANPKHYNPLEDDAQAMALVKKFELLVSQGSFVPERRMVMAPSRPDTCSLVNNSADLNRAVCECVAKIHAAG